MKKEADLANQIIRLAAEEFAAFIQTSDRTINFLQTFVLGETASREFSHGQDLLIDMLAGMLADPKYLLYWAFEVWGSGKCSHEFMELLGAAYLRLSDLNPPPADQIPTAMGRAIDDQDVNAYQRLAMGQNAINQQARNPLARPNIPAPPIPAQNGASNGWNGIRTASANGNVLQALRGIDRLSPQDWREMFN